MLGTPIIVPVHLDAICVGDADRKKDDQFAPPLDDFSALNMGLEGEGREFDPTEVLPFLRDRVEVQRSSSAAVQRGVHLHWQMPAALTHGVTRYRITSEVLIELLHQGFPPEIAAQLARPAEQPVRDLGVFRGRTDFTEEVRRRAGTAFGDLELSKWEKDWYASWVSGVAAHLEFPALPDRWLVNRVWTDDGAQRRRAWLIEGDYVTAAEPVGHEGSPTIPWPFSGDQAAAIRWPFSGDQDIAPAEWKRPYFRYLGRVRRLDEVWPGEEPAGAVERVSELTALGYGEAAFAAYLPHCRNVFGFYDSLDDLDGGPAELLYVVTGWYSRPEDDPFDPRRYPELGSAEFMKPDSVYGLLMARGWSLQGLVDRHEMAPQKQPVLKSVRRTFYAGALREVQWDPRHEYIQEGALGGVSVAIGSSEAEALAAYLGQAGTSSDGATPPDAAALTAEETIAALGLGILKTAEDSPAPKLEVEEAQHAAGFQAEDGGVVWAIARKSWDDEQDAARLQFDRKLRPGHRTPLDLPPEIASKLEKLNRLQRLFDTLLFFGEAERRDLFVRWYYHLSWRYGSGKETHRYLERANGLLQDLEQLTAAGPLPRKLARALSPELDVALQRVFGELGQLETAGGQVLKQPIRNLPALEQVLHDVGWSIRRQFVDLANRLAHLSKDYQLRVERAPRYFRPNEPHLLVVDRTSPRSSRFDDPPPRPLVCLLLDKAAGPDALSAAVKLKLADDATGQLDDEAAAVTNRVLADVLARPAQATAEPADTAMQWGVLLSREEAVFSALQWGVPWEGGAAGDGVGRGNPWHPILLEWEVEFGGFPRDEDYRKNFITEKAELDENGVDLKYGEKWGVDAAMKAKLQVSSYTGTIVLSRQAGATLREQAERYRGQRGNEDAGAFLADLPETGVLSQALAGFNDALASRIKEMQLAVFDPYAYGEERTAMLRARAAIGRYNDQAPYELGQFNPIRAGYFGLKKLRLIDAFGQVRTIENPAPMTKYPEMIDDHEQRWFLLPPRLVQPSRLLFRWLSAAGEETMETNSHPDTSPVCGWVVSNCLDQSLVIYAQDGQLLGAIAEGEDQDANPLWESAPGVTPAFDAAGAPSNIADPELRAFVRGCLAGSRGDFLRFRDTIERVLLTIEPQNDPEQDALAVLMGRPLALARAMLCLELKGPPAGRLAADRSYDHYDKTGRLDDEKVADVQFPVRLGDLARGSDGLVGYFAADEDGRIAYDPGRFQAEDPAQNILLAPYQRVPLTLLPYQRVPLTLLVDPRASVHAASGILPVKTIDIPLDHYAASLRRMAFTFAVHPLLTTGKLRLPLPAESDQAWAWLSLGKDGWLAPRTEIGKVSEWANFEQDETLRLVEGWLQVNPFVKQGGSNSGTEGTA